MAKQFKEIKIPFGAKDSELCGWEYTIPEGMEATIVDNKIVVKKKESEDERVRIALKEYLINSFQNNGVAAICGVHIKDILSWLKKRGEQNQKHFELKAEHWYICHRAFCCRADHLTVKEGERFKCEKDGVVKGFVIKEPEKYFKEVCPPAPIEDEQKPVDYKNTNIQQKDFEPKSAMEAIKEDKVDNANKVRPKFKVGDWIVFNGLTLYINEVVKGYYRTISKGGITNSYDWDIDNVARLWTIQDAKDGDVLATLDYILIFKKLLPKDGGISYCLYAFGSSTPQFTFNEDDSWYFGKEAKVYPATKEQRDTLFAKMKEAGYEWDAEKKELRKIEQKQDVNIQINPSEYINDMGGNGCYLKNTTQSHAWSEEDEKFFNTALWHISYSVSNGKSTDIRCDTTEWLKALKDRCTWKPSDEQMHYLSWIANIKLGDSVVEQEVSKHLNELYKQLKQL